MKIPVPTALAAVVVVASCAAAVVVIYGDGWFHEIEPAIEQTAVTKMEPSVPAAAVQIIEVEKLEIDFEGRRVLLPDEGWISVAKFWDIYYNQPQKLTVDIDYEMLHKLEELIKTEPALAEGSGDPSQQPDTSDQTLDLVLDPSLDPSLYPAPDPSLDLVPVPEWDPARNPV